MLSTVRIGMVGAGAVAARHLRTLHAMEGVEVAAVADPALKRARKLAEPTGAAVYPNHMELLAAERLDAVYICVPPFAHGAPELAVIDAGLPLFVEKPVAIDLETATTGAGWTSTTGPPPCWPIGRPASSSAPGWTRSHRRAGGPAGTARAARRSSRAPTSWTSPEASPARSPRSTRSGPAQRSPLPLGPRAPEPGG
jgi:Oxidoreductase family, NAD-binding Rossmann fold